MKGLLLLTAGAAAIGAVALSAQTTSAKPDSTCTKYSDGRLECRKVRTRIFGEPGLDNVVYMRTDSAMAKRAALGIELRATGTRRDTLGVFVEAVTPKGPAEAAGIIEGDRIAAINGVDLRTSSADVEDAYTNGLAAHRLTREVQKLTPGSRVTLRVYSGGRYRDVQVVAGKASDILGFGRGFRVGMPGPGGPEFEGPGAAIFGPELELMRDRVGPPLPPDGLEPLLRQRMDAFPKRIQIRSPGRVRNLEAAPRIYKVDAGADTMWADAIRAMVGTTIQDARSALRQLAAEGVA
ncbi:MAG TPA: PDZ domain-containing protein [Gemmatimonadaceae bacterium]|nr:PDZ domain-containing protein [Gemmatimonadaceae bacterium]